MILLQLRSIIMEVIKIIMFPSNVFIIIINDNDGNTERIICKLEIL